MYPRCSRVLMLNPSVGEIVSIDSPLNLFRIVVFPALSRPLKDVWVIFYTWKTSRFNSQQQYPHFLLLLSHFLQDRKESHSGFATGLVFGKYFTKWCALLPLRVLNDNGNDKWHGYKQFSNIKRKRIDLSKIITIHENLLKFVLVFVVANYVPVDSSRDAKRNNLTVPHVVYPNKNGYCSRSAEKGTRGLVQVQTDSSREASGRRE